jgi:hypothetical protein
MEPTPLINWMGLSERALDYQRLGNMERITIGGAGLLTVWL